MPRRERGLVRDAAHRLWANRAAKVGMGIVLFFIVVGYIVAPIFVPYNPRTDRDLTARLSAPSQEHPFGTDELGRDILTRIAHGTRISFTVGLAAVVFAFSVGTVIGLLSGYVGGQLETVAMRAMDVLLAFPALLLAIAIVAMRGPGLQNTMFALGITYIPVYARLSRASAIGIKQLDYITAATAVGVPGYRMVLRHVLPNSLSPLIVQFTLMIATAIIETAALGFLGLGAQPPSPEWGAMLSNGYKFITVGAWWALLFPGLAIILVVTGFNLVGDGLRDALDPRLRRAA
ncbi:MAG: ABC transporter permease subunit [Anaerolineae bacterium]|nr:ABC transporter permease subunit [Anaerolineae bacterium]NIN98571.1 ABC transporter permease subunit [Anaerolineae bacterium]NIQ81455.1 ABC transporter permease subunit [Anaerolineae bacterium]